MSNDTNTLVQKLWGFCNVLRDDGVSYGDYVEQLTYMLFLKMADEQSKPPFNKKSLIPDEYNWSTLINKDGDELEVHYRHILENLAKNDNILGVIFRKAQNKIQDPAKLKRLVTVINDETWMRIKADIKGDIYEGLLEKNAQDIKSGAGQYFTPRQLIKAIVEVMKPQPNKTICDPACGTGGFFLEAHKYIAKNYELDKEQKQFLRCKTFKGWEVVDSAARLCVMNLYLNGITDTTSPITVADSLISIPSERFDMVLTNPPFGKKSSITIINEEGKADKESITYERNDFWAITSNKQLNFVQHIKSILKTDGRAAVVVPDNVLFEGGAGQRIREQLLKQFDVHTLLRLPTGIFYAQGVKANVIFFDKKPASETNWTKKLWVYDLRTNKHFTLKENPLNYQDLEDFIKCYNPDNRHQREKSERFKAFDYEELIARDKTNLDIFWLKDESLEDSENLPEPNILAQEIIDNLESALDSFSSIYEKLGSE